MLVSKREGEESGVIDSSIAYQLTWLHSALSRSRYWLYLEYSTSRFIINYKYDEIIKEDLDYYLKAVKKNSATIHLSRFTPFGSRAVGVSAILATCRLKGFAYRKKSFTLQRQIIVVKDRVCSAWRLLVLSCEMVEKGSWWWWLLGKWTCQESVLELTRACVYSLSGRDPDYVHWLTNSFFLWDAWVRSWVGFPRGGELVRWLWLTKHLKRVPGDYQ